jgi:hypothetical protein
LQLLGATVQHQADATVVGEELEEEEEEAEEEEEEDVAVRHLMHLRQ